MDPTDQHTHADITDAGFNTLPGNKLRIPVHRYPEGHNIHNIHKTILRCGFRPKPKSSDATRQLAFLDTTNIRRAPPRCKIRAALLTSPLNSSDAFTGSAKESVFLVLFVSRITEKKKLLAACDVNCNGWHSASQNFKL